MTLIWQSSSWLDAGRDAAKVSKNNRHRRRCPKMGAAEVGVMVSICGFRGKGCAFEELGLDDFG